MIESLHEKTVFEERVLSRGPEVQKRQILNRELGELITRRRSLIAELAGINSRIGIVERELNPVSQTQLLDEANTKDREQGYRTVATAPAYKYLVQ